MVWYCYGGEGVVYVGFVCIDCGELVGFGFIEGDV